VANRPVVASPTEAFVIAWSKHFLSACTAVVVEFFHEIDVLVEPCAPHFVDLSVHYVGLFDAAVSEKHPLAENGLVPGPRKAGREPTVNVKLEAVGAALRTAKLPIDDSNLRVTNCKQIDLAADTPVSELEPGEAFFCVNFASGKSRKKRANGPTPKKIVQCCREAISRMMSRLLTI
jgi:hypothetical protein